MDPSWHHNYASLGWFDLKASDHKPHYPSTDPALVQLISALHAIAHQAADREAWFADPVAFADRFKLSPVQREALIRLDVPAIVAMGAPPAGAVPRQHAGGAFASRCGAGLNAPALPDGASALWVRPGYLVRRLHQIAVAIFLDEMSDLDLTPVQFGALTIIASRPGIEQSVLGAEIGIDRVNTGDVVVRLIKNDLARREVSPRDRRFKEVSLTPKGEAVLGEGTARMTRVQQRLLAPLEPSDREIFLNLLMQLITGTNDQCRAPLRLPKQAP